MRYSRDCGSYQDFLDRGLLLTRKLLNQGFLLVKLKSSLRKFYGHHHDLLDRYGISVSPMICSIVVNTSWLFPHSWRIIRLVIRLTRRLSLVEQELPTIPEHIRSPPVYCGVHVTRTFVLYVCFVDRCLSLCTCFAIVLSVLRYTNFDYPFGIFKLFLLYKDAP